ncbi:MAG TPA: hypothetical protein PLB41_00155 [Rubrivivax sp.]|nr:hypothetical protein [Rubrivivax sp.]HPO17793.1 hypothetical protein [Rubrivivax sp.]
MAAARVFGVAGEDLEFDFARGDRAALVTALLDACAATPQGWWPQPVGARTAALLALLRASESRDALALTLRCAACGAPFEIELEHEALAGLTPDAAQLQLPREGAEPLTLRLPTGEDLRAWRALPPAAAEHAGVTMLARLSVAGTPRPGDEAAAAALLAQADPLVSFGVACSCPSCGAEAEPEVDLEGLALQRLAVRQRGLLHEVHALASHYGWTEAEVLAVPPARRARYLELIEGNA